MNEQQIIDEIENYAAESAAEKTRDYLGYLMADTGTICESPIERVMLAALYAHAEAYGDEAHFFPPNMAEEIVANVDGSWDWLLWWICPQLQVGSYRVDFGLFHKSKLLVVIECDGHDYHERTKDQAARDRSRDRELQSLGPKVFRFTGREIWRDAIACAKEAFSVGYAASKSC